jgi:hypothetical protein
MEDPIRVLVVEHRHADHGLAAQPLSEYDLDFSLQCVKSPLELRPGSAKFDPNIMLCTDNVSVIASHAVLDALRMLCSQTPVILLTSVREADASIAGNATARLRKTMRLSLEGVPDHSASDAVPPWQRLSGIFMDPRSEHTE